MTSHRTDPNGYYTALEVDASASSKEIKDSYLRLIKKYHPDLGGPHASEVQSAILNNAFYILGDENRRKLYDQDAEIPANNDDAEHPIEPIRCDFCGKISVFPRHLVFWNVFSLILVTSSTPVQGVFCSTCARKEAMRTTVLTSLVGWWGIPWGPILTVGKGFSNAAGGEGDQDRDEAMAWYNALAFTQAGQFDLAFGVAQALANAKNLEIRASAAKLTEAFRQDGVSTRRELKDPWKNGISEAALRFGILAVVPCALTLAVYIFDGKSNAMPSYAAAPQVQGSSKNSPPPLTLAEIQAGTKFSPPIPTCKRKFVNGQIMSGSKNLGKKGHRLEINNGSDGDAIVKIRQSTTNRLYASFFIKRNLNASLSGISDGDYIIQYATGTSIAENCKTFISPSSLGQFPGVEGLFSERVDDFRGVGVIYKSLAYTLYAVPGGNVSPEALSLDSFGSD